MDWWLTQFLSIVTYVAVCFFACLLPALCLQRVRQNRIWHEIICNLNCLSGGVFAATFFILYNHVRHDFKELLKNSCAWHDKFALDTVVVFCGFLLTALVEKLADFVQHRLATSHACDKSKEKLDHQTSVEKAPLNVASSPNHHHHHNHSKPCVEEMSPLTAHGRPALPTLTVLNCSRSNSPLKLPIANSAFSPDGIKLAVSPTKNNSLRRSDSAPAFDTERRNSLLIATSSADVHNLDEQDPHNCGHTHHHHHQHQHVPEDLRGSGTKRFIVVIVSLSAHSLFEGMALGMQANESLFKKLFLTILLHEALVALAIGLSISQQHSLPAMRKTLFCLLFAVIVPVGQVIGIIMKISDGGGWRTNDNDDHHDHNHDHGHSHGAHSRIVTDAGRNQTETTASCDSHGEHGDVSVFSAVVQATAAGTFLFVTFMEILSERLNCHEFSIIRIAFILAGFLVIPAVTMLHHTLT